jgi:hypothetical protein
MHRGGAAYATRVETALMKMDLRETLRHGLGVRQRVAFGRGFRRQGIAATRDWPKVQGPAAPAAYLKNSNVVDHITVPLLPPESSHVRHVGQLRASCRRPGTRTGLACLRHVSGCPDSGIGVREIAPDLETLLGHVRRDEGLSPRRGS